MKKPVWTRAMRREAAEHGRRGGRMGNLAGKQRGGLVSWHTKTPEQQQAALARLARYRRHGHKSPKAKAAQAARAKAQVRHGPLSAAKAHFLADAGMLRREPARSPVLGQPSASQAPRREDYGDDWSCRLATDEWHREKYLKWAEGVGK